MNTMNAKGRHILSGKEFFDSGKAGDWTFAADDTGTLTHIIVRIPNGTPEGDEGALPLRAEKDWRGKDSGWWQWDGNIEAPTLTPSILHHKGEWHGYMTRGELISC